MKPSNPKQEKVVKLNYKKMVEDIDELVETDFCFDMDCRAIHPKQPFTHEESIKMRDILMKIYSIAHCNTCTACQGKYLSTSLPKSRQSNKVR